MARHGQRNCHAGPFPRTQMMMQILLWIIIVVATFFIVAYQRDEARRQLKEWETKEEAKEAEQARRDAALDFVLRYYSLNLVNPYVRAPGFDDKRCYHCLYPEGFGHGPDCPWVRLESLTRSLYQPHNDMAS